MTSLRHAHWSKVIRFAKWIWNEIQCESESGFYNRIHPYSLTRHSWKSVSAAKLLILVTSQQLHASKTIAEHSVVCTPLPHHVYSADTRQNLIRSSLVHRKPPFTKTDRQTNGGKNKTCHHQWQRELHKQMKVARKYLWSRYNAQKYSQQWIVNAVAHHCYKLTELRFYVSHTQVFGDIFPSQSLGLLPTKLNQIQHKLAPYGTDGRLFATDVSAKSRDTKTRTNTKNPAQSNLVLCPSLSIRGQLPAPIVNGEGDSFWKWPDFQLWRAHGLDLDHGSGHTTYRRASLIDLYLHTIFCWNRRNVLWTDGSTDENLRPAWKWIKLIFTTPGFA